MYLWLIRMQERIQNELIACAILACSWFGSNQHLKSNHFKTVMVLATTKNQKKKDVSVDVSLSMFLYAKTGSKGLKYCRQASVSRTVTCWEHNKPSNTYFAHLLANLQVTNPKRKQHKRWIELNLKEWFIFKRQMWLCRQKASRSCQKLKTKDSDKRSH